MASESSAAHVLRMVWPFGLAYAMSYALRTINAVLAPNLVDELSLSASELGLLASAYFLSFALMQIPLGAWLDRDGPRRVESLLLLLAIDAILISHCEIFRAHIQFSVSAQFISVMSRVNSQIVR